MTRGNSLLLATSLALCTACATTAEHRDRAVARVEADVDRRVGVELTSPQRAFDDGRLSDAAGVLLAGELSEDAAIKIALLENRAVRANLEDLGIAAADLVQAGLLSNPVFSANAKHFGTGTEIELALAQPFLDLFFRPLRQRMAAADLAAAEARVTRTLVALVFDVRRAFVDLRSARSRVALQREVFEAEQAAYDLMHELHRAGNVTDPQLTAEEAALSRARLDLAEAEADTIAAREPLQVLLGLWGSTAAWRIESPREAAPAQLDLEHIEGRAIAASLELAESAAVLERHAQRVGLVRWQGLFSGGELGIALKREASDGDWGLGPAGAIALPVLDAGGARRAAADAELQQALARHVELAVGVRSAARVLRDRNRVLMDRERYLREVDIGLRSRLVMETLRNFNAMQIGVFDVFRAKEQEIGARREHLEIVREAALARLDLEQLLAGALDSDRAAYRPISPRDRKATAHRGGH